MLERQPKQKVTTVFDTHEVVLFQSKKFTKNVRDSKKLIEVITCGL